MLMDNLMSNHTLILEEFMALLYPKVCFLSREKLLVRQHIVAIDTVSL